MCGLPRGSLTMPVDLYRRRIASAVTKGNQPLADAWSKALAETMADGSYAAVSKKYFNEDVRCN